MNAFVQGLLSYVLPPKPEIHYLKDSVKKSVAADSQDGPVKETKPVNKKSKIPLYSAFEFVSHFCQSLISSKYFAILTSCQFFISCLL